MVAPKDIGWGKYKQYEGPYFKGTRKFQLPAKPSEEHRLLAVITSTEGGSFDAINMYDRCILSTGLLQWCEAKYFLTSKLLGAVAGVDSSLLGPLQEILDASNAQFVEKSPGKWRFFWRKPYNEVDDAEEQKKLFLSSTGHQGSWDIVSEHHAKLWAAAVANVLAQDAAVEIQTRYTANRVRMFATLSASQILFDGTPSTGWTGATRAIFLSFAANLPAAASTQLQAAVAETGAAKWSKEWCIHIARRLTFGPGISIYPHRYNAIRPVVEKLYGVDLPDMAGELKVWKGEQGLSDVLDSEVLNEEPEGEPTFTTIKEVQKLLVDMGYDLGPAGADGVMGRKTKEALMVFQGNAGLKADGMLGVETRAKMVEVWRDKVCV